MHQPRLHIRKVTTSAARVCSISAKVLSYQKKLQCQEKGDAKPRISVTFRYKQTWKTRSACLLCKPAASDRNSMTWHKEAVLLYHRSPAWKVNQMRVYLDHSLNTGQFRQNFALSTFWNLAARIQHSSRKRQKIINFSVNLLFLAYIWHWIWSWSFVLGPFFVQSR